VIDVRFTPDATKLLRSSEMTRCANKRLSLNREEGLQVAGIAPPEVGSDSGRHQALGAERATAAFS
jgi:hypothetical protein